MSDPTHFRPSADEIETVYRRLIRGVGHELVNDGNVAALIKRALQDEHILLAQELREWRMPCGPGGAMPGPAVASRGFSEKVPH